MMNRHIQIVGAVFSVYLSILIVTAVSVGAISSNLITNRAAAFPGQQQSEEAVFFNRRIESCATTANSDEDGSKCADVALDKCFEDFPSTAGQVGCIEAAKNHWSGRMEAALKELKGKVSKEEAEMLKVSQEKWHGFAVSRADLQEKLFEGKGTMYLPWIANGEMKIVRERALELESYAREYYSNDDSY